MRKVLASIAAAGVLVAGAFIASTVTTSEASAQTEETPQVTDQAARPERGIVLDGVLDDLVTDGTLTQAQADSVKDALVAKHDELKEQFGDRRERRAHRYEMREQFEAWLEDGVITADELDELDVDLPRFEDGPLAEALEDGQITQAEWDAIAEQHKADRENRRNARWGTDAAEDSLTG